MPRAPRVEADVGVGGRGGACIAHQVAPGGAVGGHLDTIAGDGCAAVVGRRVPRQIDAVLTVGVGGQARGRVRRDDIAAEDQSKGVKVIAPYAPQPFRDTPGQLVVSEPQQLQVADMTQFWRYLAA